MKYNNIISFVIITFGLYSDVKILVKHGADINACDNFGFTTLITVSAYGHIFAVKGLIGMGAGINLQTNRGSTAIDLASNQAIKQVIETSCRK